MSGLLHGWGHFHGILGSCWSKVGHLGSLTFKGMSCPWLLPALFLFPGCHKVSSFLCHMSSLSICSNSLQTQRDGASQQRTEVSETMLYDKSSFLQGFFLSTIHHDHRKRINYILFLSLFLAKCESLHGERLKNAVSQVYLFTTICDCVSNCLFLQLD